MTIVEGFLLGILQGLTEFLPVSSSGHLCLMQYLFGVTNPEEYVLFDLVLHLGTLAAVVLVFRNRIVRILRSERMSILYLALGFCSLIPFYFAIPFLKSFYSEPRYLGYFFIVTSLLLILGERAGAAPARRIEIRPQTKGLQCIAVGASQIIAVLPGVSRSGITLSVGRMLGWKASDAAEFSFLLVIPVILAGTVYESVGMLGETAVRLPDIGGWVYAVGFISSFIVGIFALKIFLAMLERGKFIYFAIYCALLGVFCVVYFNLLK